jgi:hypothetical protein
MIRFRLPLQLLLSGACMALIAPLTPASAADNQCIGCHQDSDFYARHPRLHAYYQDWLESPHKMAGTTCDDCHGGNPDAKSMSKAHSGVLPVSDEQSALHFRQQPDTCGRCHNNKRAQFIQSKHYQALTGQRTAPTCTTCHPAMNRRPEYRSIVLNACRNCHDEGNSEKLPLISDQAESMFQQLNIASGFLGWANIYYESHGWPEDSAAKVRELGERYQLVLDQVHKFDMNETEAAMSEIQGELREMFDTARRSKMQEAEAGS